jgi:hypothetical protein
MHGAIKVLLAFFGFGFLGLGAIFLIAGGSAENYIVAVVMMVIGIALLFLVFRTQRQELEAIAKQTHLHEHRYDIKMEGSGEFTEEKLVCPYCGAPADQKDVTVVSGGLMIKCQYCQKVSQLEEAPKW